MKLFAEITLLVALRITKVTQEESPTQIPWLGAISVLPVHRRRMRAQRPEHCQPRLQQLPYREQRLPKDVFHSIPKCTPRYNSSPDFHRTYNVGFCWEVFQSQNQLFWLVRLLVPVSCSVQCVTALQYVSRVILQLAIKMKIMVRIHYNTLCQFCCGWAIRTINICCLGDRRFSVKDMVFPLLY